jgi:hypothetical protein
VPVVKVEPTNKHKPPYVTQDDVSATQIDALEVAANTAEALVALGAPLETDPSHLKTQARLLKKAIQDQKTHEITNVNTAFAASAFLKTYGQSLALDVASARAAITNKLMELANCGDPKFELKALELLGKHSDIGLFTERSEVTINYKNASDLEDAINERLKRLLNASLVDVTPISANLDDELGTFSLEEAQNPETTPEHPENSDIPIEEPAP